MKGKLNTLLALCVTTPLMLASALAIAKPLTIGMSFQEMNNPYFVTMQEALKAAAGSMGATVIEADARHDV